MSGPTLDLESVSSRNRPTTTAETTQVRNNGVAVTKRVRLPLSFGDDCEGTDAALTLREAHPIATALKIVAQHADADTIEDPTNE